MQSTLKRCLFLSAIIAGIAIDGFASPAQSELLSLVPASAQIVAGIEDPHNPISTAACFWSRIATVSISLTGWR